MPTIVNRLDPRDCRHSSEMQKAKGREALRDMLPLVDTYVNNPTKYCWERIVDFYEFNADDVNHSGLPQEDPAKWRAHLSRTYQGDYEQHQGMILLSMVMLREQITNLLKPRDSA